MIQCFVSFILKGLKIMKKIISALLFTALIFTSALGADGISYDGKKAEVLSQLNILKGDEDGFRLDSSPTRIEAVIIMLRLTGSEQTALEKNLHHPFSDVPDWASATQDMPMLRRLQAEYPKTNSAPTNRLPLTSLQHSRSALSATTTQTAISTLTAL